MLAITPGARWLVFVVCAGAMAGALVIQTARLKAAQRSEASSALVAAQWRANFDAMETTNAANVRALAHLQAEAKRSADLAATARAQSKRLDAAYEDLRKDLYNAAEENNLSPSLCHAFDELRRLQGQAGPACRH